MSAPPRSGPAPYDWNQPTPLPGQSLPGRPGDGRRVAQQAHHGDADPVVPYQGGPRFGSKVWILDSEPQSDATWAKHNGCKGPLVQPRNYTATYTSKDPETRGQTIQTTAIYRKYEGCPPTAPVEWCAACLASLPPVCGPSPVLRGAPTTRAAGTRSLAARTAAPPRSMVVSLSGSSSASGCRWRRPSTSSDCTRESLGP